MLIEKVMTKDVLTLSPDDTVLEASIKMTEKRVSGAPVIDDAGRLVGMISEADILRSLKTTVKTMHLVYPSLSTIGVAFKEKVSEKEASDAYKELKDIKVGNIMTSDVQVTSTDENLRQAIKKMISRGINRLPVVDENQKVIGIVTRGDILRGIAMENMNNSEKK